MLWIVIVLYCIGFTSCSKDKDSNLVMSIFPSYTVISAKPDSTIRFVISVISKVNVKNIKVTRDVVGFPKATILDSLVNSPSISLTYDFFVDEKFQGNTMVLEFSCYDESGKTFSVLRRLNVSGYPLTETAGHTMYSRLSGKVCAYDLIAGEGRSLTDSLIPRDIMDNTTDTLTQNISKSWVSPSRQHFVIYNEFDYANATTLSAKNGYTAGIKLTELSNLAPDNIVIAKITRDSLVDYYVVIKIINIVNDPGSQNDKYIFNLKKR